MSHRSIDGVRTRGAQPITRRETVAVKPRSITQSVSGGGIAAFVPNRVNYEPDYDSYETKQSKWQRFQLPLILFGGTIGGMFAQTAWFGIVAIAIYGIASFILHIPSRTTFTLAALSFLTVSLLLLFKPDMVLASTFTTYAFLLLGIGVIALIIEARPQKRRRKRRGGR
jgi:hypothetical protein